MKSVMSEENLRQINSIDLTRGIVMEIIRQPTGKKEF
jgi:hypothetical protein